MTTIVMVKSIAIVLHMKSAKEHTYLMTYKILPTTWIPTGDKGIFSTQYWNRPLNPLEKCQETIREWLEGKGSTPVTWETFIEALDRLELRELSNKLRQELK